MTSEDLRDFLDRRGLSQADFARLLGVTSRGVALWMQGKRKVPGPVIAYVRLYEESNMAGRGSELVRLFELKRLQKE